MFHAMSWKNPHFCPVQGFWLRTPHPLEVSTSSTSTSISTATASSTTSTVGPRIQGRFRITRCGFRVCVAWGLDLGSESCWWPARGAPSQDV